ncbi:MAG: hypothetical protein K0R51_1197 [Cytophagaceae bacterium]|jgi:hypothetical protein|nr:hypothetical protein [Cytophagaceae bacterium]
MKKLPSIIAIIALFFNACTNQNNELQVGGLYLLENEDGTYMVSKILALDYDAVHLRPYKEIYASKPNDISSDTLNFMIGHIPLDRQGFLADKPIIIKVEAVKESELEGYKIYLDAMNGK